MALIRNRSSMRMAFASALVLSAAASAAQTAAPAKPFAPPQSPSATPSEPSAGDSDTWIFSGVLQDRSETFSGTLITSKSDTQFELKLANGATCDGADLKPSLGLVRLGEIQCTDGRPMRALFVPQPHQSLKVFGHVGDTRFSTIAHILGTAPIPEPQQTTAPHAPMPEHTPNPAPGPGRAPGSDPG